MRNLAPKQNDLAVVAELLRLVGKVASVIGWNYHQRQQRTMMTEAVWKRVEDVNDFYTTTSVEAARAFLDTYGVRYVVVGQLERGLYDPAGIAKFDAADGDAWEAVFRDRDTVIYEVKK